MHTQLDNILKNKKMNHFIKGNLNAKAAGSVTAKLKAGELTTNGLSVAFTAVSGKDNLDIKFDAPKLLITKDKASGDKVTVAAKITNAPIHVGDRRVRDSFGGAVFPPRRGAGM